MAKLGVELSCLINTGNFENFGMRFWVEDENREAEGESPGQAHERLFNFVHKRLSAKASQIKEEVSVIESRRKNR